MRLTYIIYVNKQVRLKVKFHNTATCTESVLCCSELPHL